MKIIKCFVIVFLLPLLIFGQTTPTTVELERYLIQELETKQFYQIFGSKDKAAFFGFFIDKGQLENASVHWLVKDSLITAPFSLWNSKRFLSVLRSFMPDTLQSRWVIVPILFKNISTEESSKTVLVSQKVYKYMLTGVSLLSSKYDRCIISKPFIVFFSDPYID